MSVAGPPSFRLSRHTAEERKNELRPVHHKATGVRTQVSLSLMTNDAEPGYPALPIGKTLVFNTETVKLSRSRSTSRLTIVVPFAQQ